jgi:hypothetical protein
MKAAAQLAALVLNTTAVGNFQKKYQLNQDLYQALFAADELRRVCSPQFCRTTGFVQEIQRQHKALQKLSVEESQLQLLRLVSCPRSVPSGDEQKRSGASSSGKAEVKTSNVAPALYHSFAVQKKLRFGVQSFSLEFNLEQYQRKHINGGVPLRICNAIAVNRVRGSLKPEFAQLILLEDIVRFEQCMDDAKKLRLEYTTTKATTTAATTATAAAAATTTTTTPSRPAAATATEGAGAAAAATTTNLTSPATAALPSPSVPPSSSVAASVVATQSSDTFFFASRQERFVFAIRLFHCLHQYRLLLQEQYVDTWDQATGRRDGDTKQSVLSHLSSYRELVLAEAAAEVAAKTATAVAAAAAAAASTAATAATDEEKKHVHADADADATTSVAVPALPVSNKSSGLPTDLTSSTVHAALPGSSDVAMPANALSEHKSDALVPTLPTRNKSTGLPTDMTSSTVQAALPGSTNVPEHALSAKKKPQRATTTTDIPPLPTGTTSSGLPADFSSRTAAAALPGSKTATKTSSLSDSEQKSGGISSNSSKQRQGALLAKYCPTALISCFAVTLNCGKHHPPQLEWLPLNQDVYVIGVQECSYKPRKPHSNVEADLIHTFLRRVGRRNYGVVCIKSMWEIRVLVIAKQALLPFVNNVESSNVATGIAGVAGNKGGVGVSFTLFDTSFCFVCAHLAARPSEERCKARNKNAIDVLHKLQLGARNKDDLVNQFNFALFLGDLNYRVVDIDRSRILEHVKNARFKPLVDCCQLVRERAAGRALDCFVEAPITFAPTYRYQEMSDDFSKKKLFNLPSYTDRILHAAHPQLQVTQHAYDMMPRVFGSDHRPVVASFDIRVHLPQRELLLLHTPWNFVPRPLVRARIYSARISFTAAALLKVRHAKALRVKLCSPFLSSAAELGGSFARLAAPAKNASTTDVSLCCGSPFALRVGDDGFGVLDSGSGSGDVDARLLPPAGVVPLPEQYAFLAHDVTCMVLGHVYAHEVQRQSLAIQLRLRGDVSAPLGIGRISLDAFGEDPRRFAASLKSNGIVVAKCVGFIQCSVSSKDL